MAVAKNPGIGQGRGGGRPKGKARDLGLEREVKAVQLRLSPRAVELVRAAAEVGKVRPWHVVELAILAALDAGPELTSAPASAPEPTAPMMPPEALEIAQECAAFLEAQENRPRAVRALRRAWKQALALARHDLAPAPDQG